MDSGSRLNSFLKKKEVEPDYDLGNKFPDFKLLTKLDYLLENSEANNLYDTRSYDSLTWVESVVDAQGLVNSCKLQMLQILDGDGEEDSDEEMYEGEGGLDNHEDNGLCGAITPIFSRGYSMDIQIQLAEFHGCKWEVWLFL